MTVFIFAGTTEGRVLSKILSENDFDCTVSVATSYGESLLSNSKNLTVLQGRLNHTEMKNLFLKKKYDYIIDATHPFATEVSKEIKKACVETNNQYVRISRNTDFKSESKNETFFYFNDIKSAGFWLENQNGNIFVTTGSKELPVLANLISDKSRIFARVLPSVESLQICTDSGIPQKQIIAMQGPFSEKTNELHLSETKAEFLLTKETGINGGFFEKIEAAEKLGIKIAVIKNPERAEFTDGNFTSVESFLKKLKITPNERQKNLYLIGSGMGQTEFLMEAAKKAIESSDVIFAGKRIENSLKLSDAFQDKKIINLYKEREIISFLNENPGFKNAAVLFSGDVGFYSGSKDFYDDACLTNEWKLNVINGISSPVYFAAKLHKSWQNWKFLSLHGAKCNITENIRKNPACFFILSGAEDIVLIGKKLKTALENGLVTGVNCYLGSNLSYDVEKIIQITPEEMLNFEESEKSSLYVLLIENKKVHNRILRDEDFIREPKIPMTKQEVRQASICELNLSQNSVLYDIGSGSGSVSVEAARIITEGQVFAFDCKKEAVLLTQKNVEKFSLENVTVIEGTCPKCLEKTDFPLPTHAFIGGSKGNLSETISFLLKKNPEIRITANFVSLENLCEMQNLLKTLKDSVTDVQIKQIQVSKAEKTGDFHLMKAQNLVYIVSFSGKS